MNGKFLYLLRGGCLEEIICFSFSGLGPRQAHKLGSLQQVYYDDLAETAGIESIDLVVSRLSLESTKRIFSDLCNFREAKFKIIDKENYVEL
jgi:dimethylaniline monooxygenase (N-oxide forming)